MQGGADPLTQECISNSSFSHWQFLPRTRSQRGIAATKSRFFAALRMTCHPDPTLREKDLLFFAPRDEVGAWCYRVMDIRRKQPHAASGSLLARALRIKLIRRCSITRWIASVCGVDSIGTRMEHMDSRCRRPPSNPTSETVAAPTWFA